MQKKEAERQSRQNAFADGNFVYLGGNNAALTSGLSNVAASDGDESFNLLSGFQPQGVDGPLIIAPQNPVDLNTAQINPAMNNFGVPGGLPNPSLQFPNLALNNNPSQNNPGVNNFSLNVFQNNGNGNNPSANSGFIGQGLPATLGNSGFNNNPRLQTGINNPGFGLNNYQGLQGFNNNQGIPGFVNNPGLASNQGIPNLVAGNLLGGLPNSGSLLGLQGVGNGVGLGRPNGINGFPRAGNFFNPNTFPLINGFLGANRLMGNTRPQGPNNLNGGSEQPSVFSSLNPFSEEKLDTDESPANALISNRIPNSSKESTGRSNSQ